MKWRFNPVAFPIHNRLADLMKFVGCVDARIKDAVSDAGKVAEVHMWFIQLRDATAALYAPRPRCAMTSPSHLTSYKTELL